MGTWILLLAKRGQMFERRVREGVYGLVLMSYASLPVGGRGVCQFMNQMHDAQIFSSRGLKLDVAVKICTAHLPAERRRLSLLLCQYPVCSFQFLVLHVHLKCPRTRVYMLARATRSGPPPLVLPCSL